MSDLDSELLDSFKKNMPKLSDKEKQSWINNPLGLQKFLMGLIFSSQFKILKSIELGTNCLLDLRKDVRQKSMKISPYAIDILEKPESTLATCKTIINLAVASVEELGFKKSPLLRDIYAKIKEIGGELCPSETGIQLRRQYPEQPLDELLKIAMEPITDSQDCPRIFSVWHGPDYLWLDTCPGRLDCVCEELKTRFVFVLPRK